MNVWVVFLAFAGVLALAALAFLWGRRVRARRRPATLAGSQGKGGWGHQASGQAMAKALPKDYSPKNVGNDASARPWEHTQSPSEGPQAPGGWGVPADFDVPVFLAASKHNFVQLQAAWDRADVPALRAMMTDAMTTQIQEQLLARESHTGAAHNSTEVLMLEAQLLGIEDLPGEYMASVEFSGVIREDAATGPSPFREVWNITRSKAGEGGWLVAGVQALQ